MAPAGGNVKKMTVMGDALMDRLSDRGSIPIRSSDEPEFGYYEFGFGWFSLKKCRYAALFLYHALFQTADSFSLLMEIMIK